MSRSMRRKINNFVYDLNDELNELFSEYLKAKKRYQYWHQRRVNFLQKKSAEKKLKSVIKEIKETFHFGFQEFNQTILKQKKVLQELKKHKSVLLQRKVLWKGEKFES